MTTKIKLRGLVHPFVSQSEVIIILATLALCLY